MKKLFRSKKKMAGVYMILELTLLLCATLFIYNNVNWMQIATDFATLITNIETTLGITS